MESHVQVAVDYVVQYVQLIDRVLVEYPPDVSRSSSNSSGSSSSSSSSSNGCSSSIDGGDVPSTSTLTATQGA